MRLGGAVSCSSQSISKHLATREELFPKSPFGASFRIADHLSGTTSRMPSIDGRTPSDYRSTPKPSTKPVYRPHMDLLHR